ncbi:RlpA-like double-psi beta-barrel-protein domain-containing protein-containing protein [Mycena olivaceomarginata]|nr:RlpA-like double-psi beta-barrel-protein domain-containing protein-containing protein [Mycena olivaceomarginata]
MSLPFCIFSGQSLGACGDVYDDQSFTAAVSMLMFDNDAQCHIPLTATVTNKATGKSVQVKIVDRCVGCKVDDIDMTPAGFAAIADMSLGRTTVTWRFDDW